jgi:hypothetical protein
VQSGQKTQANVGNAQDVLQNVRNEWDSVTRSNAVGKLKTWSEILLLEAKGQKMLPPPAVVTKMIP